MKSTDREAGMKANRACDEPTEARKWSRARIGKRIVGALFALVAIYFADRLIGTEQVNLYGVLLVMGPTLAAGAFWDLPGLTRVTKIVTDALPWASK